MNTKITLGAVALAFTLAACGGRQDAAPAAAPAEPAPVAAPAAEPMAPAADAPVEGAAPVEGTAPVDGAAAPATTPPAQ